MRLSIIIPCYNSAAAIRRCLDSVYALSLQESEFEVIVVNDGSTDETGEIVGEYVTRHANLTLIRHLVNRNLGAARNTGIAAAKGDCIGFVDSDDEVGPGLVSAFRMLEEKKLDMVAMRVEKVKEDGTVDDTLALPYSSDAVFSGINLQEEHPFWCSATWGYLYSRSLIDRSEYPFAEGVYFEDVDFVCCHLYRADRLSYCDECGYRKFINPTSITHSFSYKHIFGYAFLGTRMLSLFESLEDKSRLYALSVLEGGSFNIMKAFKYLFKCRSISEVCAFYNMFDSSCNRRKLWNYRNPAYCWTIWTRFCLRHRQIATLVVGLCVVLFNRIPIVGMV